MALLCKEFATLRRALLLVIFSFFILFCNEIWYFKSVYINISPLVSSTTRGESFLLYTPCKVYKPCKPCKLIRLEGFCYNYRIRHCWFSFRLLVRGGIYPLCVGLFLALNWGVLPLRAKSAVATSASSFYCCSLLLSCCVASSDSGISW